MIPGSSDTNVWVHEEVILVNAWPFWRNFDSKWSCSLKIWHPPKLINFFSVWCTVCHKIDVSSWTPGVYQNLSCTDHATVRRLGCMTEFSQSTVRFGIGYAVAVLLVLLNYAVGWLTNQTEYSNTIAEKTAFPHRMCVLEWNQVKGPMHTTKFFPPTYIGQAMWLGRWRTCDYIRGFRLNAKFGRWKSIHALQQWRPIQTNNIRSEHGVGKRYYCVRQFSHYILTNPISVLPPSKYCTPALDNICSVVQIITLVPPTLESIFD